MRGEVRESRSMARVGEEGGERYRLCLKTVERSRQYPSSIPVVVIGLGAFGSRQGC